MATHIAEFSCFQIELSKAYNNPEWRDDIKQLMLKAGLLKIETVFLFSDTQVCIPKVCSCDKQNYENLIFQRLLFKFNSLVKKPMFCKLVLCRV